MKSMISHLSLGVSNLERSKSFYDAAFKPLGYEAVWSTEVAVGYGLPGGDDELAIKLVKDPERPLAAAPRSHYAFKALSRNAVDGFYQVAMDLGGKCNGKPGLRPSYSETY